MAGFNRMFDIFEDWQSTRRGKKIGDEIVRSRNLIKEIDEKSPHLTKLGSIDPALQALLEEKVRDGRMTQAEFEAELRKYDSP